MSPTPAPLTPIPIDHFYLYPVYNTQESYAKATGQISTPFDNTQDIKQWACAVVPVARQYTYPCVDYDADGNPVVGSYTVTRQQATVYNLPPGGTQELKGTGETVPVPLKPLPTGWTLSKQPGPMGGGAVMVCPPGWSWNPAPEPVGKVVPLEHVVEFTQADRVMLSEIYAAVVKPTI